MTCAGCGCPRDQRNPDCRNCQARHSLRDRRARAGGYAAYVPARLRRDELGERSRVVTAYLRANPGRLDPWDALLCVVWPSPELLDRFASAPVRRSRRQRCRGCGAHIDERTTGCKKCAERHYRRALRMQAA